VYICLLCSHPCHVNTGESREKEEKEHELISPPRVPYYTKSVLYTYYLEHALELDVKSILQYERIDNNIISFLSSIQELLID
jgi:hypothetical protein